MPTSVENEDDIEPGEFYEDSFYHPCVCVGIKNGIVWGISLIDGTFPRQERIDMTDVRKLTLAEVWRWKLQGPDDVGEIKSEFRWWDKTKHHASERNWTVGRVSEE